MPRPSNPMNHDLTDLREAGDQYRSGSSALKQRQAEELRQHEAFLGSQLDIAIAKCRQNRVSVNEIAKTIDRSMSWVNNRITVINARNDWAAALPTTPLSQARVENQTERFDADDKVYSIPALSSEPYKTWADGSRSLYFINSHRMHPYIPIALDFTSGARTWQRGKMPFAGEALLFLTWHDESNPWSRDPDPEAWDSNSLNGLKDQGFDPEFPTSAHRKENRAPLPPEWKLLGLPREFFHLETNIPSDEPFQDVEWITNDWTALKVGEPPTFRNSGGKGADSGAAQMSHFLADEGGVRSVIDWAKRTLDLGKHGEIGDRGMRILRDKGLV